VKYLLIALAGIVALGAAGSVLVGCGVMNRGVIRELREEPDGERAKKVMLITLPSGKQIPVNYLREGDVVYAGADFPWWRELRGEGGQVTVLIRGETLTGHGRAVEDDPDHRKSVFARLRPNAVSWAGTLVEIHLADGPGS
jgi:hypothetical protein